MERGRHRSAGAQEIGGLDVVAALRHARRIARLSQRDLASRAGVSQSQIARIESRRVDPPVGLVQHLLGQCGLRWDLQLASCGTTPAKAAAVTTAVRKSACLRAEAAGGRRMRENAAARGTAERLAPSWRLTVRQRRAEIRAARLAERAQQAIDFTELIRSEDQAMHEWLAGHTDDVHRLFRRRMQYLAVPLADRLPRVLGGSAGAEDVRGLLAFLALAWPAPPVALAGSAARAVWSPVGRRRSPPVIDLALLGEHRDAVALLRNAGAQPRARGDMFDLGEVVVRLRRSAPPSTTLVRWRPGRPGRAIPVARPEWLPGGTADSHAVRAVLTAARRDGRGRRYPPYHEAIGVPVRPVWFDASDST